MKKNDVFTFTAPNGAEVTGIVLSVLFVCHRSGQVYYSEYLCYSQHSLIIVHEDKQSVLTIKEIIINHCIIPEYDDTLERYEDLQVAQAETQSWI